MEVNQKMILTLTASIMYWSLQQQIEGSESSPSLSPSMAASINGEDKSSLIGEVSKLTMDDTAFDTAVSSQAENENTSGASIYRVLSLVQSQDTPLLSDPRVSSLVEKVDTYK